ncbi:aldehyde dehydrogenase family protein [Allorhodopirellula solitaria]|uniref:Sulfoacetaldehyde dehydrogenase n=1 Tax=Allorhodopirellula solitaria TaxID=2527987 RepID=A0A5C5WPA2_9BACT|nr:aldehyde dehydrogenase family protein [Allorhodopirellula solitaria]TWT51672.1 Sulfoacetaldehyde dehydrogenase [Allorhodopirellula solitaria]
MSDTPLNLPSYICGEAIHTDSKLSVYYPYDHSLTGTISQISADHIEPMITGALSGSSELNRYDRSQVLTKARDILLRRSDEFAHVIRLESGLCMRETHYEVGRAADVLQFAAAEALKDDGQIFSCDVSPQGKQRKIFTIREPLKLALAITPFNHPLNQVAHKIAPAIAAGVPVLVKPSDKTPLTAVRLAEVLYEAGLPRSLMSVFVGDIETVVEPLIADERIELVTFTGGTAVGKRISKTAGYKKLCLELGGNAPLIVLDDADMEMAVKLAAEGSFRNSGQRCTAVKRLLIHEKIKNEFVERFVERTKSYIAGDPASPDTLIGTVIDEASAKTLEARVHKAVASGAKVLEGGRREGALLEPTIIDDVPRDAEMIVEESFGPLAPIITVADLDDAIAVANDSKFGLSSGVVTNSLPAALECVRRIRTGTVNVNEVPGYRIECSPFGGCKDSGLGVKEGVIEAIKFMSNIKTFSLPW